jgi:hypothetical protein
MEVESRSLFVTRMVTVSPSRMRKVGPGNEPLMVVAISGFPVKLTGVSAITRSKLGPISSGTEPVWVLGIASLPASAMKGRPEITPPAASP